MKPKEDGTGYEVEIEFEDADHFEDKYKWDTDENPWLEKECAQGLTDCPHCYE